LRSTGHDPIQNVSVTAALPASFTFIGASVAGTPCTSGPANLICIVPSIPAGQSAYLSVEYIADQPGDFPVTFVASAAGDNDPSNNTRNLTVSVRPFLDVRIQAVPQSIDVTPGQVFNMPVIIAADRRPVPNVTLSANLPNYVTAQSASAEGGTCVVSTAVVNCTFSEIAAGTTRQIDISARAETIPDLIRSFVDFTVNASTDLDYGNNRGSVPIRIDWSGDASLAVSQASASATTGQSFSFPTITVSAAERIDEAYVEISLPAMSLVVTADAEGGSCSTSGSGLRCQLSTLMTGTSRRINLTLRANSAGSGTSTIHLSARNDHNAQNDSQTVSLTITDPPPPAGGGGTGDSNGGGGGGDFGELFAGTLAALLLMRRRRRGSRAIMQGHPTGSFPAFRAF
jgi:hypothetical protein